MAQRKLREVVEKRHEDLKLVLEQIQKAGVSHGLSLSHVWLSPSGVQTPNPVGVNVETGESREPLEHAIGHFYLDSHLRVDDSFVTCG